LNSNKKNFNDKYINNKYGASRGALNNVIHDNFIDNLRQVELNDHEPQLQYDEKHHLISQNIMQDPEILKLKKQETRVKLTKNKLQLLKEIENLQYQSQVDGQEAIKNITPNNIINMLSIRNTLLRSVGLTARKKIMAESEIISEGLAQLISNHQVVAYDNTVKPKNQFMIFYKTTNRHPMLHSIRSILEDDLIAEHVRIKSEIFTTDQPQIDMCPASCIVSVPNRIICDVNSTRSMYAGLATNILIPQLEGADYDRTEIIQADVDKYNAENSSLINSHLTNANNNQHISNYIQVQTHPQTLQQYAPNAPNSTLYILTDVIYYLTNADLYESFINSRQGTIAIGALHIPTANDMEEHDICFEVDGVFYKEGTCRINPPDNSYDLKEVNIKRCEFTMKVNGNNHYYTSKIRFPELLSQDIYTIPQPANQNYAFILQVIRKDVIDMGATNYVSFEIRKLTNPSLNDVVSSAMYKNINKYDVLKLRWPNIINDPNRCHVITQYLAETEEEMRAITNRSYVKTFTETMKQKMKDVLFEPEYEVRRKNGEYRMYRRRTNRLIDSYKVITMKKQDVISLKPSIIKSKLMNTLAIKIKTGGTLDDAKINTLLLYLNREKPEYNMQQLGAVLMHGIIQAVDIKDRVNILKNTKAFENINSKDYEVLPDGYKDAYSRNQLWSYIVFKFKSLFELPEDAKLNQENFM
jgi:hypothetical protein